MAELKPLTNKKTYYQCQTPVEDDDKAQIFEVFKAYDTANRGKVSIEHLPTILRLLNYNIGEAES